jgi:hypothetical protein
MAEGAGKGLEKIWIIGFATKTERRKEAQSF